MKTEKWIGCQKFLGRTLDVETMTYSFDDGSGGALPEEMRQEVMQAAARRRPSDGSAIGSGILSLIVMWDWKKRLGIDS